MKRITFALLTLAAALTALTGCAVNPNRPQPMPGQEAAVANALYVCPTVVERFLPGPYYRCEAARHFWLGDQGLTIERLQDAAAWGDKQAQFSLGVMYFNGDQAPKDRPRGIAWLALASERHNPRIEPVFVSAYRQATADERAQANTIWLGLKPTYADAATAHRAQLRYARGTADIRDAADRGGSVYLAGLTYGHQGPGSNPSAFSVLNQLDRQAEVQFDDLHEHVEVGNPVLVPLDQVAGPPAKSL